MYTNGNTIIQMATLNLNDLPDLLTVKEVAQILRVSTLTIKRWGKRGKLTPIRINSRGDRRYKKEAVMWLLGMTPKT
jgi:excisionase family DNA binding protein